MSSVCNKVQRSAEADDWSATYARNEVHVEAGSAHFSHAFAAVLGLVGDIELHDLQRGKLRLRSIAGTLERAIDEYRTSITMDRETGLDEHHVRFLHDAAEPIGGLEAVLLDARSHQLVGVTDEQVGSLVSALSQGGYAALMDVYLDEVQAISRMVSATSCPDEQDIVAWQELTWKLMTSFSRAMALGQAIAVLNTYTLRASRPAADPSAPRSTESRK